VTTAQQTEPVQATAEKSLTAWHHSDFEAWWEVIFPGVKKQWRNQVRHGALIAFEFFTAPAPAPTLNVDDLSELIFNPMLDAGLELHRRVAAIIAERDALRAALYVQAKPAKRAAACSHTARPNEPKDVT
jgi:hypothetical protein